MSNVPYRVLNRDGSFNVQAECKSAFEIEDLYHRLLSARWLPFLGLVSFSFLLINVVYASLYYLGGPGILDGGGAKFSESESVSRWIECFFFSVQTLATIGYGKVSPAGLWANCIVVVEALTGLLGIALITGLLFARFAKATARVAFSERAIISKMDGIDTFYFRMANLRLNRVVDARVSVTAVMDVITSEGDRYRDLYDLKLDRSQSPLFTMSWTIVHVIDKDSTLFGLSLEELSRRRTEILVTFIGIDETLNQSIHSRFSYIPDEIVMGAKFKDMLKRREDGKLTVLLDLISDFETT